MNAAVRLWWLLRSTTPQPRDLAITASFALITWALLTAGGLIDMAGHQHEMDATITGALIVLVGALMLTAGLAVRTLLRRSECRRLHILRSTGASRAQTIVVGALDVADSAVPGIAIGVLADVALAWLLSRYGAQFTPTLPVLLIPALAAVAAAAIVVARRVQSTSVAA